MNSELALIQVGLLCGGPRTGFYGAISLQLINLEDNTAANPTACTDGKRMWVNGPWFVSLNRAMREGVVIHEVMHVALEDPWRRPKDCPPKAWNICTDLRINGLLRASGFALPVGVLYAEQFKLPDLKSAEWYWAQLKKQGGGKQGKDGKQQGQGGGAGKQGDKKGQGGGAGSGQSDPDTCQGPAAGGGGAGGPQPDPSNWGGVVDGTETDKAQIAAAVKAAAQAVAAACQGRGDIPAALKAVLDEAFAPPKIDWTEVLREWIQMACQTESTWSPVSRRWLAQDQYMPSIKSEDLGSIVIVLDESGSMSNPMVLRGFNELDGVLATGYGMKVTILRHDSNVDLDHIESWEPGDPAPKRIRFRCGGTSHIPVFDWIEKNVPDCRGVIAMTDLDTVFPTSAPTYPVLWVYTPPAENAKHRPVPWGEVVTTPAPDADEVEVDS